MWSVQHKDLLIEYINKGCREFKQELTFQKKHFDFQVNINFLLRNVYLILNRIHSFK